MVRRARYGGLSVAHELQIRCLLEERGLFKGPDMHGVKCWHGDYAWSKPKGSLWFSIMNSGLYRPGMTVGEFIEALQESKTPAG